MLVVMTAGLRENEMVVTSATTGLESGMKVEVASNDGVK